MEDVEVMSRDVVEEERGRNTVTVTANGSKQSEQKIEEGCELLPGIPNEVTIDLIAPKLPWITFYVLSSVSRGWKRAIRSREVYNARLCSKSTQTLLAVNHRPSNDISTIAIYSIEDASCYYLPPVPGLNKGLPESCETVFLDGKLYVLGGYYDSSPKGRQCAEVFVWDLAGQQQWVQCASMRDPREEFGSGVKDGKIYVFGGRTCLDPVSGSEVYDPKEDAWSPISPGPSFRFYHKVTTVGEELFLHDGEFYDSDFWTRDQVLDHNGQWVDEIHNAVSAEVYHPLKDEWRVLHHFTQSYGDVVLMVAGKLYKLDGRGTEVYDIYANAWNYLKPFSFGTLDLNETLVVSPVAAVPVDDQILALIDWRSRDEDGVYTDGTSLIKSQGIGGENRGIVWQVLHCSLAFGDLPLMCSIQL